MCHGVSEEAPGAPEDGQPPAPPDEQAPARPLSGLSPRAVAPARTARWSFRLAAEFGHRDVTPEVASLVAESGVRTGAVIVAVTGSTAAITTIEYEPGALADLCRALEVVAPATADYAHNERWGDGNGFSHVRSALLKTSIAVPVLDARPLLGTWQQIVVINLDNRAREREVVAVVVGE